jgi:hypothetical protein
MKKIRMLAMLLFVLFSFAACNVGPAATPTAAPTPTPSAAPTATASAAPTASPTAAPVLHIADYYPIRENVHYVYAGEGMEFAAYDVVVDYTAKDRVQQRVDNGGTVMARVLAIEDGALKRVFSREDAFYRENLIQKTGGEPEILLMEPIEKGTSWSVSGGTRTITDTAAVVTTPSGEYTAVEVTTERDESTTADYYAEGIGLVKSVFRTGDAEITSSLSAVEEDFTFKQTVRFYYPDSSAEDLQYTDAEVGFKTNDVTRLVLEEAYKTAAGASKVLSENTKINSLYLNDDGMVYLDLNKSFVTEMNAGSGTEALILQSVANTFCRYYNASRMILTIDSGLYESGHIALQKGEYLTADYQEG